MHPTAQPSRAPHGAGLPEALLRFRRQLDEPAWCGGPEGLELRLQAAQDGIDLRLAAGQLVLVTGHAGSGKSRLLHRLLQRAVADGWREDVQLLAAAGPRGDGLVPWRRLTDQSRGADRLRAAGQALQCLQAFGLESLAHRRAFTLPRAQRRLAALAIALARPAPALLLDEPLAGLPPAAAEAALAALRRALRRRGSTLVVATRQPAAWLALADRLLLLEDGIATFDAAVPLPRLQHNVVLPLLRRPLLLRLEQAGLPVHIQS